MQILRGFLIFWYQYPIPAIKQLKIIEFKNENSMQIIGNVMFFVDVFVVSVTTNGCNIFTNLFREIIGAEIAFNSVENGVFQNMETLCANLRGPSLRFNYVLAVVLVGHRH